MSNKFKIGIGIIVLLIIAYAGYRKFNQFSNYVDSIGECGSSVGPCYGEKINLDLQSVYIEQYIEIPNGKFAMANISDDFNPKLIKLDNEGKVEWAIEFKNDSTCTIPHQTLSNVQLKSDKYGIRLTFFNESNGEPGRIYLNEKYEVQYICLSPM